MLQVQPKSHPATGPEEAALHRLGLSPRQCGHIAARAEALGVGIEEVAIAWKLVGEDAFYRALAGVLGLNFVARPFRVDRDVVSPYGVEAGVTRDAAGRVIAAPRGPALRLFLDAPPKGCALSSPRIVRESLRASFRSGEALAAAGALPLLSPRETAHRDGSASGFVIAAWFIVLVAIAFCEPAFALPVTIPLSLLFIWTIGQRIMAIAFRRDKRKRAEAPALAPRELPVYSVLVPLYREERVLGQLIGALEALDYPPEKLEILLLVEENDRTTRDALAKIRLQPFMRIVPCPDGKPRTKPRALNIGLRECRGEFVAIYDAEDIPDPDQLLKAAALFRASPHDVACLQAEIVIENGATNFLTRGFALEYAALFQIVVPGLCEFDLPVALGGTSNHFRRDVLFALNGWDAWNVTEDADLGLRLALHGYRIGHLKSCTREEAPSAMRVWRQQRVRWIKGWMQTSLVHLRETRRRWHGLSLAGKIGVLHHLVGTPVSALLTPLFTVALVAGWFSDRTGFVHEGTMALGSAVALAALAMMVALYRDAAPLLDARDRLRALIAMPVYLLLVCSCAWLALAELVRAPFHWNKTPHGESLPDSIIPARRRRAASVPPDLPVRRIAKPAKRRRKTG